MKNKDGINYILLNTTFFVLFLYLLSSLNILNSILNIIEIIFLSIILSYVVYPIYKILNKFCNNVISMVIIYLFLLMFILFLVYSIIPNTNFINKVIDLLTNILKFIDRVNIKYSLNINLESYLEKIVSYIINNGMNIIANIVNYLSKFIFVVILSVCILLNVDYIKKFVSKTKHKELIYNINDKLKNYLLANVKIILIQFIEYTLIFFLIGHPNYLLLGLLNSINSFIPYIGTLLTNILAITTASVISKKLLILTSIVSILLPNIDSYIITPKIYKNTNKLPETLCIMSIIIFGSLFDIFGIIFAIPILIIILEILRYKNIVKDK